MDVFARGLVIADKILTDSDYEKLRTIRHSSFDAGKGAEFASGKMGLEELYKIGIASGEPTQISGKQELFEQLINLYI